VIRILAISGSLRVASSNSALLRVAVGLAPANVTIAVYGGLADLPPFNPDLDREDAALPATVGALRDLVATADGLLIASPEYAHGVPGALKNALDWLVSSVEFPGKPVALLNARPQATHAYAALAETLRTMAARLVTDPALVVPITSNRLDEAAIVADSALIAAMRAALAALARAIECRVDEANEHTEAGV
jgi:chromate reductase